MAFVGCELKFIMKQPLVVALSLICALTIIMAVITTCRGELQFIAPSENLYCHTQSPCVTLDTFVTLNVTEVETANRTNLSLELLPGNHKLTSELIVMNLCTFTMSSNGTNYVSVTCSQLGRLIFENIDEVSITGLKFLGCGQNEVKRVNMFLITKSKFHGGINTGTALIINNSSAVLTNSHFLNNTQGMNYTYNNTRLGGGTEEVHVYVGGAVYITHSEVTISNCSFDGNSAENGGSLFIDDNSTVNITNSTFRNNSGTVIYTINSTVHSEESTYKNNTAIKGAVVYSVFSHVSFHGCKFYDNWAEIKCGVVFLYENHLCLNGCEVINNSAERGGAIQLWYGTMEIKESTFNYNRAVTVGGVMDVESSTLTITDSMFNYNYVESYGIFHLATSELILSNTTLSHNNVQNKGVINAQDSIIESRQGLDIIENRGKMSIVHFVRCNASFYHTTRFINNTASFMVINSNVTFIGSNTFERNNYVCSNESKWTEIVGGGAFTSIRSGLNFYNQTTFRENYSKTSGGAIFAVESYVRLYGDATVEFNQAEDGGGGVYLYRSTLSCKGNCSIEGNEVIQSEGLGGGVHAISSSIKIRGQDEIIYSHQFDRKSSNMEILNEYPDNSLSFKSNSATHGGGMCFEGYSKLYIIGVNASTRFENNTALLGGAIFVNDNDTKSICASEDSKNLSGKTECFFQKLYYIRDGYTYTDVYGYNTTSIQFAGNSANKTGSILFGGLLDRCTVSPFSDVYYAQYIKTGTIKYFMKGIEYFETLSNNMSFHDYEKGEIASYAVRICFCDEFGQNCSSEPPSLTVKKGEEFTVSLVVVDQVERSIAATVYSTVSVSGELGHKQHQQKVAEGCKNLMFSVKSTAANETLMIHADGPCDQLGIPTASITITFNDCTCPLGFHVANEKDNACECKCDLKLHQHLSECSLNTTVTVFRREDSVWIGYFEQYSGYVIYRCPFDYCNTQTTDENINLNFTNGSDSQCAFNRSGLLCGSCKPGFSLSIGSSHCVRCKNTWPVILVGMIVFVIVYGIILVTMILVLDLTVAVGTINGLLFYANIVGSDSNAFLQFKQFPYLIMILKGLNMTVSVDACFIKGMNGLIKTWIKMLFPAYVFALILGIILLSKYSPKFAQCLGKGNPVAVLATLILLFYAKLLKNMINIFSFAIIKYPDNHREVVWSPDASIKYLRGSHISLFLLGILILALVLLYTILLFSWQWLLPLSNKRLFRFVRNTRLNLFMEANLAPYKPKYRFWTGLLLFVRIILHLVPAMNYNNNPHLNLLAVGLSVTFLIALKAYFGNSIYKTVTLDYLELSYYFNIVLLTVVTSYFLGQLKYLEAAATASVSIALVMFLGTLVFHIVQTLRKAKCINRIGRLVKIRSLKQKRHLETDGDQHPLSLSLLSSQRVDKDSQLEIATPTSSVVTLSPQHSPSITDAGSCFSMNDDQRNSMSAWIASHQNL